MECKFKIDEDCCNRNAIQYMSKCKFPCEFIVPITNADYICASNKVLAEKLTDCTCRQDNPFVRPSWADPYGNSYLTKQDAIDEWIEWLEQPV